MTSSSRLDALWGVVRSIPKGRVASYGVVGRSLDRPVSGLLVGKWMTSAPEGVPWWRVVGADGSLVIARRGPEFALQQKGLLESEGVRFDGERVSREFFVDALDPLEG